MHVYKKVALRAARSSDRGEKPRSPSRARHEIFPNAAAPRRQSVADGFLTRQCASISGNAGAHAEVAYAGMAKRIPPGSVSAFAHGHIVNARTARVRGVDAAFDMTPESGVHVGRNSEAYPAACCIPIDRYMWVL